MKSISFNHPLHTSPLRHPFPFFPLGKESIIHAFPSLGECPLQQGLKSGKFNRSEVKIEMRQLNLGTPFLDEHFILRHVYGRDPCRGQPSVNTGLHSLCFFRWHELQVWSRPTWEVLKWEKICIYAAGELDAATKCVLIQGTMKAVVEWQVAVVLL